MKLIEIAFFTDNVNQMIDFYKTVLSMKPVAQSDEMAVFVTSDVKIFIHHRYIPRKDDLPPENHFAFLFDDVDDACKYLSAHGLFVEIPPIDFYWGRSAYLRDPDGHQIEILQSKD